MAFQGDLANINLASVLQNLLHNEQTGSLRLFDDERETFLYVDRGRVTMYSSGPEARTPVGEYLSRAGDATARQLTSARKRLRGRRNLSAVLGGMGVEPGKIREAVRRFLEEEVCDLFTWESGRFEFTEGVPPPGVFDSDMAAAKLSLDPNSLILEAARRADTWDQINRQIRSQSEIFVLRKDAPAAAEGAADPEAAELAKLLDGRRDVAALAEDSGLGRFPTMRLLSQLIAGGVARPISLTEVIRFGEVALGKREFADAVRFYRRALEIERNNLACRRGLIQALEGAGDRSEAGSERKLLAATLHEADHLEEAAEELRQAIADGPTDITAREKYVALLKEMGAARLAEAASLDLGQAYLSLGIPAKARQLFAGVLKARPHQPARVAMLLAEACVKAADVPAAVAAYRQAAGHYLAAEEYDAAAGACEEILRLQPENAEAKKRLEDINTGRVLRRKRLWKLVQYLLAAAAVAALGVLWLVYDSMGRGHLDEMAIQALAHAERSEFDRALACYDEVRASYPLTGAAASARRLREALAERVAVRMLGEARRSQQLGLRQKALDCCRRAEAVRPSARTLALIRRARQSLEKMPPPPSAPPKPPPPETPPPGVAPPKAPPPAVTPPKSPPPESTPPAAAPPKPPPPASPTPEGGAGAGN